MKESLTIPELAAAVLADPEALWAVYTSGVIVLGPWVPADRNYPKGTLWRLLPPLLTEQVWDNPWGAKVSPSPQVRRFWFFRPHLGGFRDEGDVNYQEAMRNYALITLAWKPWTASWYLPGMAKRLSCFAPTVEAAQVAADEAVRAVGVLLLK